MTFEELWEKMEAVQGETFTTVRGLDFTYEIRGGEMFVDRRKKSITRATVKMAYDNALELGGVVKGPKKLKVFGASYLYPVFGKIGLFRK